MGVKSSMLAKQNLKEVVDYIPEYYYQSLHDYAVFLMYTDEEIKLIKQNREDYAKGMYYTLYDV